MLVRLDLRYAILLMLVQIVLGFTGTIANASDRLALLIGNSQYEHAVPLRNAENDISIVGGSLVKAGFQVTKTDNLTLSGMQRAFDEFVDRAAKAYRPTLIVYFAGHGIQHSQQNYLIPVNAQLKDNADLPNVAINAKDLMDRLNRIGAELSIVILNACRDNPFENASRGFHRGLSRINETSGSLLAFSTSPGKIAQDGNAGTSPYASAFAESILVPGLSLGGVFERVRRVVYERTSGKTVGERFRFPPI